MGINPAGRAGAIGPPIPLTPIDYSKTLAALRKLRPKEGPFVLRLNRFFWSDGPKGIRHFLKLTRRYTKRGYRVELQLRYHPTPEQEGNIHAWVRFVREVVRKFGPNSSDRASRSRTRSTSSRSRLTRPTATASARGALVRGVMPPRHGEAPRLRPAARRLQLGISHRPVTRAAFWSDRRDHGGKRFVRAVDWVGLDAYPGTIFPPTSRRGGYRDGMVNAMSVLRECYMPIAGLAGRPNPRRGERLANARVPADPSASRCGDGGDGRRRQRVPRQLRRHRLSLVRPPRPPELVTNFQQHYGLLRDDYSPKPAFGVYRELVRRFDR